MILQIGFIAGSISRAGGGIAEIARRTAQLLAQNPDIGVSVFSLHDHSSAEDVQSWLPLAPILLQARRPKSLLFAHGLHEALSSSAPDLCHAHGIWSGLVASGSNWCRQESKPFMMTVHGMLEPWALANSNWKKRLATKLYVGRAHHDAQCVHVNTEAELRNVRNYGLKNPICVIPNGIDLPETQKFPSPIWKTDDQHDGKDLLFLGRFHPKKGLLELLEGWQQWKKRSGDSIWRLVIAGWDDGGHEEDISSAIQDRCLQKSVRLIGSQFGEQKDCTLAHADAFILPSHSEGLPMAVLEAWSYGLPVLMTTPCNLTVGFKRGAAYEITTNPENIAQGLDILSQMSEAERKAMGDNGKKLVLERFTWDTVRSELEHVYRWLIGEQEIPDCVVHD